MLKNCPSSLYKLFSFVSLLVLSLFLFASSAQAITLQPGDIVVANQTPPAVVKVNPVTGAQTVISSGNLLIKPYGVAVSATGEIFVSDGGCVNGPPFFNCETEGPISIIKVDPATGNQSTISQGGDFCEPWDIAIEDDGNLLVADQCAFANIPESGAVFRINPATGAQQVVSSGGSFSSLKGIVLENDDNIVVSSTESVIRVNPTTGDQTVVSSGGNFTCNQGLGIESNGDLLVGDCNTSIYRVDPVSGSQTLLSAVTPLIPYAITVNNFGDILAAGYATFPPFTSEFHGLISVDPVTGTPTILSADGNISNALGVSVLPGGPSVKGVVASPATGTFKVGIPFSLYVNLTAPEAFNAARSQVAVSSNLTIESISTPTTNACGLQYTQTPTTTDPSFAGAIYGGSSASCTAFSMVLTPNATGAATVNFSNASIKAFDDNGEILGGVQDATFNIQAAGPDPSPGFSEFTIDNVTPTYAAALNLFGNKNASIVKIFVDGDDTDSVYPTSTSWEHPVNLVLGANTFEVYGEDASEVPTATQSITINRHTLGDINGDTYVDLIDASLFAVDWDKTENLTYILSDMNNDGVVDLTDLSILAKLL